MSGRKIILMLVAAGAIFAFSLNCFADAVSQIAKADKLVKNGDCKKAQEIYQSIINSEGKSNSALKAQRKLVTLYIYTEKTNEAETLFTKMLSDYAGNANLAEEIYWVARGYRVAEDYSKAENLYEDVIKKYPNSPFAVRSAINIKNMQVWNLIKAGQFEQAKSEFNKMTKEYSKDSYLPEAMFWTARKFRQAGQYEKAQDIYTQIIQQYSGDSFGGKSAVELSNCMIQQMIEKGQDQNAIASINKMFSDNPNNVHVLSVASKIAELYQVKSRESEKLSDTKQSQDNLNNAAAIWEMIIAKAPSSANSEEVYGLLGNYYYQKGSYEKSIRCYEKIAENDWNAQFMLGRNYEAMKQANQIPALQADEKIRENYQQLVTKYPDCQAAKHARKWLGL